MWKKGSHIEGRLVENPDKDHWIVSIDGKLVGVKNKTGLELKVDQTVEMEVVAEKPISFRLLGKVSNQAGLNLRI